jgi:uncharacterized protein
MTPVTRVRGHTLLCLQGFRGEGYSPDFVENLAGLHQRLREDPESLVEVQDHPDDVCAACPHRSETGCTIDGPESEEAMIAQDREVLARLGLKVGMRLPWREVLLRISGSVTGDDLPAICGTCRWLPLGYCREGMEQLRGDASTYTALLSIEIPRHT